MVECGKAWKIFSILGPAPETSSEPGVGRRRSTTFSSRTCTSTTMQICCIVGFRPVQHSLQAALRDRPSGRTPELGTKAMTTSMRTGMAAWHIQSFTSLPVGEGYVVRGAQRGVGLQRGATVPSATKERRDGAPLAALPYDGRSIRLPARLEWSLVRLDRRRQAR